jgi:hypothetical protein
MIALALAAGLFAQSPLAPPRACSPATTRASGAPTMLMRPQDWSAARPRKLGDLPDAQHEYAVLRLIGGCMVPAPIGYHPPAGR